jgi:hypothetical protein
LKTAWKCFQLNEGVLNSVYIFVMRRTKLGRTNESDKKSDWLRDDIEKE